MGKNRLGSEKSPYLAQHKDNPVWWFPWGEEAFIKAKNENKPIFLSIGYSTCHWCHVMEKDSFEKQDVADVLNKNFIAIKVDREERPDIDAIYMAAVQAMTGGGGWPMSTLLTPDGKPFWGGTFLPHQNFMGLLEKVSELWAEQSVEIFQSSEKVHDYLKSSTNLEIGESKTVTAAPLNRFYETFQRRFDKDNGGTLGAPKFASALGLSLLLRIYRRSENPIVLQMVTHTLDQMRRGGLYDQLGGGFHRYTVDEKWRIPHFEKMLYDNALLSVTYLEAFQVSKKAEYLETAKGILDYVLRDMTDSRGGFYSAEDADSENIEGKFYVWSEAELKKVLEPQEFLKIKERFNITGSGNFHAHKTGDESKKNATLAIEGNHFYLNENSSVIHTDSEIQSAIAKLLKIRSQRVRPHLDNKVLTSWNGLMISGFAKGYQVAGETRYLEAAKKAVLFILSKLTEENGQLLRNGKRALCEDYSFLIEALLNLYECDFDPQWYLQAVKLQEHQDKLFWDETLGSYFENDGQDPYLIIRQKNFEDSVIPSSNSVSALNNLKLYALSGDGKYTSKTTLILQGASRLIEDHPQAVSKLLQSIDRLTDKSFEVAVFPKDHLDLEFLRKFRENFYPNHILSVKTAPSISVPLLENRNVQDNQTTFYICENQKCLLPLHDYSKVETLLRKTHSLQ